MVTEYKCNFCGKKFEKGFGIMFVKNDGSILYFCSSKCRKNKLKLRRNPKKFKWTEFYPRKKKIS